MEVPLIIQITDNTQKAKEMNYTKHEGDEVEDLFLLLDRAKTEFDIEVRSPIMDKSTNCHLSN